MFSILRVCFSLLRRLSTLVSLLSFALHTYSSFEISDDSFWFHRALWIRIHGSGKECHYAFQEQVSE